MDREELLARVEGLIRETQGVAFIVPEDTGYFSIDDDMVRNVRRLIVEATLVLREITDFYDAESAVHGEKAAADVLKDIGAQISSELAAREVSGLAFVARGQLMEIQESLEGALENRKVWAVASHADAGLRHSGKALIAIESAICEYEGLQARDRRWIDIPDSLEIRRLYGQFRRAILRGGDPGDSGELTAGLRSAATRIAVLRNLQIYPFLRIDDRLTIRRLQKRIVSWLRDDGNEEAGQRLWQDLISFARLLMKVNDREELLEHDRKVGMALLRMLYHPKRPAKRLTDAQLKELELLKGRDDELDHFILLAADAPLAEMRATLERVCSQLQRPFETGVAGHLSLSEEG
jgi:hypothetical protein